MEQLIEYFRHIPSSHRTAILVGGLTFFFLLESFIPMFRYKKVDLSMQGSICFLLLLQ